MYIIRNVTLLRIVRDQRTVKQPRYSIYYMLYNNIIDAPLEITQYNFQIVQ